MSGMTEVRFSVSVIITRSKDFEFLHKIHSKAVMSTHKTPGRILGFSARPKARGDSLFDTPKVGRNNKSLQD
jgi:hypothetical protein